MKKQLLLGSAFLAALGAYSQNGRIKPHSSGSVNMATQKIAAKFTVESESSGSNTLKQPIGPVEGPDQENAKTAVLPPSTINWKLLCGSININGMLVSNSRPLQYNNDVNAISFVHRKSVLYQPTPAIPATAQSGVIVAEISTNWGATFDSTCLWSNSTNWGRYPQGAIYNPVGNTNLANAYIVGSGPTVSGTLWTGNFYASKKLNAFNTTADAAPNAQQMLSFSLPSYPANQGPHGWSRQGFTSTDDGVVRSLALIQDDQQGLATMRGVSIVKGTFNAGVFNWTTDSIVPSTIITSLGAKVLTSATGPQMVWNESGTVGYVIMIGALSGATNSNKGYQPIIYKTTNSGTSWALLSNINFNSVTMAPILNHLAPTNANPTISAPYFADLDAVVDANNKLHIGATIMTGASIHNDSLNYIAQYSLSVNSTDLYKWGHVAGNRPYLYDFSGDGTTPWVFLTVDSLSSEAPSPITGGEGFNDNPWAPSGTAEPIKTDNVDSRIQLGRTPDGQYITYSWSESDTNFTNGGRKWNSLPNIKARCLNVATNQIATTEINVTKVAIGTGTPNPNVSSKATLHFMSPTTGAQVVSGSNVDIYTPFTVTNSNPLDPNISNTTWYQQGKLSYSFGVTTDLASASQNSPSHSMIYPNPASGNAVLAINLKENATVDITVLNSIGQLVKTSKANGQLGDNNLNIDLNGLSTGIYMVNVKVGNISSTKKLVVQ